MRVGIWLGHARNANEVLIGTPHGVVRAYDVRRREEGEQWNGQLIKDTKGSPQQPDPNVPGSKIPVSVRFDEVEQQDTWGIPAAPVTFPSFSNA